MPTYDYRCTKCKHTFELFHSITDDTPRRCPRCKAKAVRIPAAGAGLLFKGSGFYITDYRSKSYHDKAKQEGGTAKGSETKSEAKSEAKTESKPKSEKKPGKADKKGVSGGD